MLNPIATITIVFSALAFTVPMLPTPPQPKVPTIRPPDRPPPERYTAPQLPGAVPSLDAPPPPGAPKAPSVVVEEDTKVNRPGGLLGAADGSNTPFAKAPKFIRTPTNQAEVDEYADLLRQALIDAKALKEIEALVNQWDDSTTMDKKGVLDLIQSQRALASKELKVKNIRFVIDENYQAIAKGIRIKDN